MVDALAFMRGRGTFVLLLAILASACGSGITYTGGLQPTPPSHLQEAAVSEYASHNTFLNLGAGDGYANSTVGCAMSPMATKHVTSAVILVYAQVLCQTCPPANTGEVLPVVARLDGTTVLSEQTTNAVGDPGFQNQVDRLFPKPLWTEATEGQVPDAHALVAAAHEEAGCS